MAKLIIIGAGLAGLATALFCARRGHDVVLLEKDAMAPPDGADACFLSWKRQGVAQARHVHSFNARATQVLEHEAPEVLERLIEAGGKRGRMSFGAAPLPDDPIVYHSRRLPFEAVLRRLVVSSDKIELRSGVTVSELVAAPGLEAPHVTGVRLEDGETISADLVIDAAGRFSAVQQWLAEIGAAPVTEKLQDLRFCYLTRWYKLRPGQSYPDGFATPTAPLPYGRILVVPGDNGSFGTTIALGLDDPLKGAASRPEAYGRVLAAASDTAEWMRRGEPISDVLALSRIENRRRQLLDDHGAPVVSGYVLVGDSAMHTNPTLGRGVSLAFAHAQNLAERIDTSSDDANAFVSAHETWTKENLGVWYESQVGSDGQMLAEMEACLKGEEPPEQPFVVKIARALQLLAREDDVVARAVGRIGHLLITPAQLQADQDVMGRLMAFLQINPNPKFEAPGPSRTEFERLVAA